jgi:hypothetical protein
LCTKAIPIALFGQSKSLGGETEGDAKTKVVVAIVAIVAIVPNAISKSAPTR